VRQYIGAQMPPAITIGGLTVSHFLLADRTEEVKKRWTKQIGAPCLFQANRLLTELYKQETEYVEEKTTDTLKMNISLLLDPPPFLLPTTFKGTVS
jgi:hypothetical protein